MKKSKYHSISLGYGNKYDFTKNKYLEGVPGSIYNHHEVDCIDSRVKNKLTVGKNDSFGNTYDKYEEQCHKNMERHFYGRLT